MVFETEELLLQLCGRLRAELVFSQERCCGLAASGALGGQSERKRRAKCGKPEMAKTTSTVASPDRRSESILVEVRTLLQLKHPNIIKVPQHGYVVDPINGRLPVYMMDIGRCSVADLLETGWHTKAAAEAALRDVGSALQHFHSAGLGHMDVKPGNWLVTNKCTAASGETQLTLTLIDAGGAGRLKKDRVTSCTAEHPMQRDGFLTGLEAFFDWYSLPMSIFQLSTCSWDSEDGLPKDETGFAKASEAVANDKEFTLPAVRQHGIALGCASETLRSDKEVVMEAVREYGSALAFASETLRSDRAILSLRR